MGDSLRFSMPEGEVVRFRVARLGGGTWGGYCNPRPNCVGIAYVVISVWTVAAFWMAV